MIVDCHTHVNFDSDEFRFSEHLDAMTKVDACIVLGAAGIPSKEGNDKLGEYVENHKGKIYGFGTVNPLKDEVGLKALKGLVEKRRLSGVVMYCPAWGIHPAHSRAMEFYESVQQMGIPIFFHGGGHMKPEAVLDYSQPILLDEIARTFPAMKIVIGTMGQPFVEQALELAAKHKNVYADLTVQPVRVWQVYNTVVSAHERGVMDKLVFGSGFPASKPEECIETLLGFNKLFADTNLPTVPRDSIREIIERESLKLLGIKS